MDLYTHTGSPWCRKVDWALLEMGLSDKVHSHVAGMNGTDAKPVVEKMKAECGPHSTLPSLKIGDWVLTESSSIVYFLADEFNFEGPFLHKNAQKRALTHQWDRIADINLGANVLSPWLRNTIFLNGKTADSAVFEKAKENFVKIEDRLVAQLNTTSFLGGSQFSFADVSIAHLLTQLASMDGPSLKSEKALNWLQKCVERPHYIALTKRNS